MRISLAFVVLIATLAMVTSAAAATPTLIGTDGPGFTITLSKKTVKAGMYLFVIHDRSAIHNFHLTGPGVNKRTSVAAIATTRWTVKLKRGVYRFFCDPHAAIMNGTLKVT